MSDGLKKNWDVVKTECRHYCAAARYQWRRMKKEPWKSKAHVLFGMLPDAFRLMPRTLSYIVLLSVIAALLAWWVV